MKHLSEKRWLVAGFGITVLLLGMASASSHQNAAQLIESSHQSKQTYQVIKHLVNVFATMTVAESGRRGYVFLGDETELRRYHTAIQMLQPELKALHQFVKDNPNQTQKLARLEALLERRTQLLQQSIDLYQQDRLARSAQSQITEQSINLRDQIQQLIAEMQTEEEQQLQQWLKQSQDSLHFRNRLEFLMTGSSLAFLLTVYALLYRQFARRQQAEAMQLNLAKEKELSDRNCSKLSGANE